MARQVLQSSRRTLALGVGEVGQVDGHDAHQAADFDAGEA
jgi:hypothetical protein